MCGIAALLKKPSANLPQTVILQMRDLASHRGPDDAGEAYFAPAAERWKEVRRSDAWDVGLAHRRLSILDLSAAGHQPMQRDDCWTVYNGEIYNYLELRQELEALGHQFRSNSDTEVLLAAYQEWGTDCFQRLRGMWGFVLVDFARERAVLCRDRMGIKPLYLWQHGDQVAIVSEIKQLLALPEFRPRLDTSSGALYIETGYEDPSRSFFTDVTPLPPGTWCTVDLRSLRVSTPEPYWHPERVEGTIRDPQEAAELFAAAFSESIQVHMRSDVPVGCALSGGLDSSSVAVLANRWHAKDADRLHTFTCAFPGNPLDELGYAEMVSRLISSQSHVVEPQAERFLEDLDEFLWFQDEPVGHASVYASYCIARAAREASIPVVLNGQGGDEILAGYWQSYFLHLYGLARRGQVVTPLRHFAGALAGGNPLLVAQVPVMWRRLRMRTGAAPSILKSDYELERGSGVQGILNQDERSQRLSQVRSFFLPRLLKWDDRNSMAFAVEGRYPLLDHELIELCLRFDSSVLYRNGWTKWPLRLALREELPKEIRERKSKFGFEVPQDLWLLGPLRSVLEEWSRKDDPAWDIISRDRLRAHLERVVSGQDASEEAVQLLFRAFCFSRWSRRFEVRVQPELAAV